MINKGLSTRDGTTTLILFVQTHLNKMQGNSSKFS